MVFIGLDEYGDFSKSKRALPHGLRQRKKGRFPPDCFEVIGDRMKLVKVEGEKMSNHNAPDMHDPHDHHGTARMAIALTWDLNCVAEYANDKRASVARCEHHNEYFVFNMFASREGFIEGLDKPSEDSRVFCVMAEGNNYPAEMPRAGGISEFRTCQPPWKGKTKASDHYESFNSSFCGPRTVFKWQRSFVHPRTQDYPISQGLHYVICNLKLNSTFAVLLIRWNIHSKVSYHEFVDRSFQVLDLDTGSTVKVLQFPNFHWDFRHHDMTVEYNVMRYYKMRRMFNALHAGNQATRVYRDEFTLDDKGHLICGSHDYCNWMWDLNADVDEQKQSERVFTPLHNDAGNGDPFVVLDDFYWDGESQGTGEHAGAWDTHNERAGWWVKTPNQVLCFWHNVTTSKDGKWFAAARAGRMFVWNLEDTTKVQGFSCALGTYSGQATEDSVDARKETISTASHPTVETRYLGKLLNPRLEKKLRSWHVWNGIIPEQGLWLMYDDGTVVYLDREDILDACGLRQEGKQWAFSRSDFGNLDTESEDAGDSINNEDDQSEDGSQVEFDQDENAVVFVDEGELVTRARRKRRRTSTLSSSTSEGSLFHVGEEGMVPDVTEQFMFDNELPDAETWEKMDDEGWLKRVKQENVGGSGSGTGSGNPIDGSSSS
ncbi:hypothetical protein EV426DRAFT_609009 [Tirmania nivea]|nr:hypothetical protein EV426DRAFT_609009 [Tirmania nivea]